MGRLLMPTRVNEEVQSVKASESKKMVMMIFVARKTRFDPP